MIDHPRIKGEYWLPKEDNIHSMAWNVGSELEYQGVEESVRQRHVPVLGVNEWGDHLERLGNSIHGSWLNVFY